MEVQLHEKKSLYNIRVDHLTLLQHIEDNEGELTEEVLKSLELTEEEFNEKAISYAYVIKKFDDDVTAIDKEIKRLSALKKSATKKQELFEKNLAEAMEQFKVQKVQTPTCTISFRKSKPLEVADTFEDELAKYVKVTVEVKQDAIDNALDQLPEGERDPLLELLPELVKCISAKTELSKTALGNILKEGTAVPGVAYVEKKNLQIK